MNFCVKVTAVSSHTQIHALTNTHMHTHTVRDLSHNCSTLQAVDTTLAKLSQRVVLRYLVLCSGLSLSFWDWGSAALWVFTALHHWHANTKHSTQCQARLRLLRTDWSPHTDLHWSPVPADPQRSVHGPEWPAEGSHTSPSNMSEEARPGSALWVRWRQHRYMDVWTQICLMLECDRPL